jgi:hypothetical protein
MLEEFRDYTLPLDFASVYTVLAEMNHTLQQMVRYIICYL